MFKCYEAYDLSAVLEAVKPDGLNWIRSDNGEVLEPIRSLPMAGIFEIGQRLLR